MDSFNSDQNENTRIVFAFLSVSRWLGFRLDMLAAILVTLVSFVCVLLRFNLGVTAGTLGLLLTYLLNLTGLLQWAVRQSTELENLMVSTERVFEYADLEPEAAMTTETKPPEDWPSGGKLSIKNMSLTYPNLKNPDVVLAPILNDINIEIEAGTKVGIVGRTGAGKSSILQSLFRIVEPTPKSIEIDGIITSEIGLHDLRSRLSIVPQEPFCFKGTLRFNLDPFNQYTDDELWKVLEAVELKQTIIDFPCKLESLVAENGSNWSFGERQLICLARASLRNTKLIVLDEASSSIDIRTDKLIQKAIRAEGGLFANSTVLTIAHRLNTIIDYDNILVLDAGKVVEFGPPSDLLRKSTDDPSAWFARMVQEMGHDAQENLCKIAFKQ
jgi:ATP-binding cassette subfamily C (CFTR/MRP) protein 4